MELKNKINNIKVYLKAMTVVMEICTDMTLWVSLADEYELQKLNLKSLQNELEHQEQIKHDAFELWINSEKQKLEEIQQNIHINWSKLCQYEKEYKRMEHLNKEKQILEKMHYKHCMSILDSMNRYTIGSLRESILNDDDFYLFQKHFMFAQAVKKCKTRKQLDSVRKDYILSNA